MKKTAPIYISLMFFLSIINCLLVICYIKTDLQATSLEIKILNHIFTSIRMNPILHYEISQVDVSSFFSQLEILRIRVFYGFDCDKATLLYQYHSYHNVKLGSINNLLEYAHMYRNPQQVFDIPAKVHALTHDQKIQQFDTVTGIVFVTFFIFLLCMNLSAPD